MKQRSNSSICVFPDLSAPSVSLEAEMDVPVGRGSSGDSLLIRNDGFVKVLLAQNTGFLVCLDGVGATCQLLHGKAYPEAYETESMSISPPMYRDKSPVCQLARRNAISSSHICVACSMTGP